VFATLETLTWGTMMLSMTAAGLASDHVNTRWIGVASGVLSGCTAIFWYWGDMTGRLPEPCTAAHEIPGEDVEVQVVEYFLISGQRLPKLFLFHFPSRQLRRWDRLHAVPIPADSNQHGTHFRLSPFKLLEIADHFLSFDVLHEMFEGQVSGVGQQMGRIEIHALDFQNTEIFLLVTDEDKYSPAFNLLDDTFQFRAVLESDGVRHQRGCANKQQHRE
jgi:hypothetical protein